MIVFPDIETVCNVSTCKGFNQANENTCDHALSPWHSRITVIGVVDEFGESYVFRDLDLFKKWIYELAPEFVNHNFKFDMLHLRARGIDIKFDKWVGDPMLMAYVSTDKIPDTWLAKYELERKRLNEETGTHHRKAGKHSLKTLAPYFLGVDPFWETDDKDNDEYVLKDARYARGLYNLFKNKLEVSGQWDFYIEKQLPWTKMLLTAEERGIRIDMEALHKKERELKAQELYLEERLEAYWKKAHDAYYTLQVQECWQKYKDMAGKVKKPTDNTPARYQALFAKAVEKVPKRVNYGSHLQMAWLLRDYSGYDITSLEGKDSTGADVLEALAAEGKEDVKTFLEWRSTMKELNDFVLKYKDMQVDTILHASFNPATTRTGRLSSSNPNLQQVPPSVRPLAVPRPGCKFVGFDADAIEAALICLYSEDPVLYHLIINGISLHDENTKLWFGIDAPYKDIKKLHDDKRQASKKVGYSLFYHAAINRIRIGFALSGFPRTEGECWEMHQAFLNKYHVAMSYAKRVVQHFEGGGLLENLFGRPLSVENKRDAYMKGFNKLIQSSASDYNLSAAYDTWQELVQQGIDATPVLFVHDFTMFEVAEEHAERVAERLKHHMLKYKFQTSLGPLPLGVTGGIMNRWEK